jgi:hypothetical protein
LKKKNKIFISGRLPFLPPARPSHMAGPHAHARAARQRAQPSSPAQPCPHSRARSLIALPHLSSPSSRSLALSRDPAMPAWRPTGDHTASDSTNLTKTIYTTPRTFPDPSLDRKPLGGSTPLAMAARWPWCPSSRRYQLVAVKIKGMGSISSSP